MGADAQQPVIPHAAVAESGRYRQLAALAAAAERDPEKWEPRFRQIIDSDAIGPLSVTPCGAELGGADVLASQVGMRLMPIPGDRPDFTDCVSMLARRIAPLIAGQRYIAIDLTGFPGKKVAAGERVSGFATFTKTLQCNLSEELNGLALLPQRLTFSIRADHAGVREFLRLRQSHSLGYPRLVLRFPNRFMSSIGARDFSTEDNGDLLWEWLTEVSYSDEGVSIVPESTTLPLSDLHSAERCEVVLPQSLFEARADTAWLALKLDISKLADHSAGIGYQRLRPMLSIGLRFADNLVDRVNWPWASLQLDAILNRRVAVHVVGIGDLIDRLGMDPSSFNSLRQVSRWLLLLKRMLVRESAALARSRGPFPGLGARDLVTSLAPRYGVQDAERLIRQRSLRHSHLLAISPYAVFPTLESRIPVLHYRNLLPAIRHADTVNMYGDIRRKALSLREYRRLLQLTWAISSNR